MLMEQSHHQQQQQQLLRIHRNMSFKLARIYNHVHELERDLHQLEDIIFQNCKHELIIDTTACEPCGPTPKICKKCNYRA